MAENTPGDPADDLAKLQRAPRAVAAWQSAQQLLLQGRHAHALTTYRNLVKQFPGVPQLWVELGIAAAGDLDFALASQACARAAELASNDPSLLVSIGQQYHRLRRLKEANECFGRAAAADPSSAHGSLSLAAWLERDRRLDQAWACVQACLARHPHDSRVLYFRAFLLHRQGLNGEAETALRDLLASDLRDPDVNSSACHLLGVVLDALGRYPEAMRRLVEAKAMVRQRADTASLQQTYDKMDRARRQLSSPAEWRGAAALVGALKW